MVNWKSRTGTLPGVSLVTRRQRRLSTLVLLAVAAGVLPGSAPVAAQEKKPTGKLEVSVAVKGGVVLDACTLYLKERAVELGKGTTKTVFEAVPQARYTIAGDATLKTSSGEIKRYVGVQEASVSGNKTSKVTLTLTETTNIEAFCSGCHPGAGDPVEKGQIVRDVHVSGRILGKKKYLDQVAKYNARIAQLAKEGKPHNLPIVLEKRKVVEGGTTVEREFYTCESCHTLHWERGHSSYARAPFRKSGELCQGCHP